MIIGNVISCDINKLTNSHASGTFSLLSPEITLRIAVRNMPGNIDFLKREIMITSCDENSTSDLEILKKMCAHLITELEEIKTKKCDDNRNRKQG